LTDLVTALRVMFDLRFITLNAATGTIVVRAPQTTMDAVTKFLENLQGEQPTVMLEIKVFQISTAFTRDLGASVPNQFTVFNVTSEINKLVNSSTYSQIVAALQASGQPINATTILAALLASASSLGGGASSPLSQPFATFGGGITLSGVTIPSTGLNFSVNNSSARTVDDVILRSSHGKAATMKIGERYPIVTTQYGASSATSSLLSSLGINVPTLGGTAIPSPQFSYEDLGLVLKTTPQVHGKLVSMDYELTIRALGATLVNGLPLLTNQEMKGTISTLDGESVVIAGMVDNNQMASINGIPLLSAIPVLGSAFSVTTKMKTVDELLVVVTPHIGSGTLGRGSYIPVPMRVPK
jgi:type II secretory pathway component GspD/PulD (secretin)